MTQQTRLFYEDVNDVCRAIVQALGGAKKVGVALRPDLGIDAAHRWLLACLNPERPERLTPEQLLWLLREARKIEFHAGMVFLNEEAGYAPPQPIDPEDERAKLQREAIQAVANLKNIADRLERIGSPVPGLRSVG